MSRFVLFTGVVVGLLAAGVAGVQAQPEGPVARPVAVSDVELVVPVADRSGTAREAALRSALDAAVARLAGERGLRDFWASPESLLSSYQYQSAFDGRRDQLQLRVRFDESALRAALRQAGVATWDRARPPVVLWVQQDGRWLDAVELGQAAPVLEVSQSWGFPLRVPDMLSEERQLQAVVRSPTQESEWERLSARYDARWRLMIVLDTVASPAFAPADGPAPPIEEPSAGTAETFARSEWTLADERQVLAQFTLPAQPLGAAIDQGWQRLNGQILEAEAFRRATAPTQEWRLDLVGIVQAEQYLQALQNLDAREVNYAVRALQPEQVQLTLEWRGTVDDLRRQARRWGWVEEPVVLEPPPTLPPMPTAAPAPTPPQATATSSARPRSGAPEERSADRFMGGGFGGVRRPTPSVEPTAMPVATTPTARPLPTRDAVSAPADGLQGYATEPTGPASRYRFRLPPS
ncbi:MAG: DUF2066 domain-containing protein [Oceanococcaceae bacterium]